MNYSSYHAVYVENKTAIGIFKHLCEEMQGSKAATHRTYSSLIIRGSLVEQLAAVLLGCDGRRQVNGDHLQQGISGRQPPPHHGLSREQSETRADCSQPAQHPSRACSCLVVNLHSQSSTTTHLLPTDNSAQSHLQKGFALLVLIFTVKLDVQFFNQFSRLLFLEVHDCIENLEQQQQF